MSRRYRFTVGANLVATWLPTRAMARLKAELTIPNPKYIQLGMLGRYRRHVPPTLCLLTMREDKPLRRGRRRSSASLVVIPRGVDVERIVGRDAELFYQTERRPIGMELRGELRPYQRRCVEGAPHQGYVIAPTGAGKSVIGCALVAQAGQRTLIVVHTSELLSQWQRTVREFLGVTPGVISGKKRKPGDTVTVAMMQTLVRHEELISGYGTVLVDEMHHTPSTTWTGVLSKSDAHYRYGLSATPERRDGMDVVLPFYFGRCFASVTRDDVLEAGGIIPAEVHPVRTGCWPNADDWGSMVSGLAEDEKRTLQIAELACRAADRMPTLVLTDRVDHAEKISALCAIRHDGTVLAHGKLKTVARREALDAIRAGAQLTVATTGILGEGVDVAGWQALVLALPMSGKGSRLTQAIGRVVRPAPGKKKAYVVDLVDEHPMALGAFKGRKTRYRKQQISIVERGGQA